MPGPILNTQPGRPPTSNDQPRVTLTPGASLPEVLSQLQRTAVQHRTRVDEKFKDFDVHRDGTITVPQFQQAVAMTWGKHAPLSQPQMELIIKSYQIEKPGVSCHWTRLPFVPYPLYPRFRPPAPGPFTHTSVGIPSLPRSSPRERATLLLTAQHHRPLASTPAIPTTPSG